MKLFFSQSFLFLHLKNDKFFSIFKPLNLVTYTSIYILFSCPNPFFPLILVHVYCSIVWYNHVKDQTFENFEVAFLLNYCHQQMFKCNHTYCFKYTNGTSCTITNERVGSSIFNSIHSPLISVSLSLPNH